jgi:hypothetical protein
MFSLFVHPRLSIGLPRRLNLLVILGDGDIHVILL